jgi:hypothetical protein
MAKGLMLVQHNGMVLESLPAGFSQQRPYPRQGRGQKVVWAPGAGVLNRYFQFPSEPSMDTKSRFTTRQEPGFLSSSGPFPYGVEDYINSRLGY